MFRYFVLRLLGLVPTMLLVTVCVFFFVHLLPGDPAQLAAGPEADEETVQMVRERLGLDRPLPEQFVLFVKKTVTGDFGISIRSQRPVIDEVADRFGPTLLLTVAAMAWAVVFGLLIGIVSAVKRGRWPDRLGMAFAVSGISMPPFALGILLMEVFSVWLGWFPTVGAESWRHYVLPSITLGAGVAAVMARFTRSALIEVLSEDYVRTARAKGLPARQVLSRHALRNALIPVVTMMGLQFGAVNIMPMVMVADSVDYYEYKTGKRTEGVAFAVLSFSIKVTLALGSAVCLAVVFSDAVGYTATTEEFSFETSRGVYFAYTVIPGITSLLAAIPILFYDLTGKKKADIAEALRIRRSAAAETAEAAVADIVADTEVNNEVDTGAAPDTVRSDSDTDEQ